MPYIHMTSGIYQIYCLKTDMYYIGSAVNIDARIRIHVSNLEGGIHSNYKLQADWDKHGFLGFDFTVVEYCLVEHLIEREQFWINEKKAIINGYNMNPTAGSWLGRKHSEQTLSKMSAIQIAQRTENWRENQSKKKRSISNEMIKQIELLSSQGLSNRAIARQLNIWHTLVSRILRKVPRYMKGV